MSWTTVCNLPFIDYKAGHTLDTTRFHNDAVIVDSVATHDGYVTFQDPNDRLVIPVRDDSLQRFTGLRINARIWPMPIARRQNIVEGWMAFAFFVETGQRLMGGIYDGQNWTAVSSNAGVVPLNEWSQVSFEYDGISVGILTLNGKMVGENLQMSLGMQQPQQNITIGHWPNGDGRYTFVGYIGRVIIDKRDYEDIWREAVGAMLCDRRLSPKQASAMKELIQRLNSLDSETVQKLRECARAQWQIVTKVLHVLRLDNKRNIVAHRKFGDDLLAAWCCTADFTRVKQLTLRFLEGWMGHEGSPEREKMEQFLSEISRIEKTCDLSGEPFDRLRDLFLIVVPELAVLESEIKQVMQMI